MGVHVLTLLGVPVHVTAWYFLTLMWLGVGNGGVSGLLWAVCVTFSILIHELGHAMVAKYFRLSPSIVLHGWGGLCAHERAERDLHDFLIIAAGPGAGLVLGGLCFVGMMPLQDWMSIRPLASELGRNLLFVNITWSLVNLLPFWPLDGGQIFRIVLLQVLRPALAERITHVVGTLIGVGAVVAGVTMGGSFMTLLAVLLTWQNISRINDTRASGPIRLKSKAAKGLLQKARSALDSGDHNEAVRLCHQIRADNIDSATLTEVWEILSVGTTALGAHEEAWSYLNRAPKTGATLAAKATCAIALGKRYEAQQLLEQDGKRLSSAQKAELERFLAG